MILIVCTVIVILVYYYSKRNHNYWTKRNVKHEPPIPLFGNHLRNLLCLKSTIEISTELYNKYPEEKVVGYYRGTTPELIVRDLELARYILNVDFAKFHPRGLGRDSKLEPLLDNLFHVDGDTWRLLRSRLTPVFTTAKLKAMFPLVVNCAEKLQQVAERESALGPIDARDLMARFTTEFIGACGLGLQLDSINNERSQFRELGKLIFSRSLRNKILLLLWEVFPEFRNFIKVTNDEVLRSLTAIVKNIREQRNNKPVGRNDFIDHLLELESKGTMRGESVEKRHPDGTPMQVEKEFDLQLFVAQVFIFFAAGFETSSSATSYTLHQLAFHPNIQDKIQQEIDEVLSKYDNKLSYNSISEMTLLDMAFSEGMRMFPSLGNLNRTCVHKYTLPGTDITIDPGVRIVIPIQGIQMDEKYFDNPKEFRPERFAPEAVKDRHKYSYLPFGEGARQCIGARLGHMQSLAGLAAILQKFSVEPAKNTVREIEVNHAYNIVQSVEGGLPLILVPRIKA